MILADLSQISAKQDAFLRDEHRHVAYGGARGGGKSWAVRTKAKFLAATYRGIKILIVRRTYKELMNNHVNFLRAELHGIASYNATEKVFTFPNKSTISFGYCASDADLGQYQGAEYDVIFIDEAGQLQEDWIRKINACVRGANKLPKRTYYTLNPGGPSHGYFKRLFVDRRFEGTESPDNYSFIQAFVTDNAALMEMQPEYLDELKNLPPKIRDAWLNGSWDVYEGQFFEDFRPDPDVNKAVELGVEPEELRRQRRWCHVIEPFDPSKGEARGWTLMRSYDFGYNRPASLGYWLCDYDGVLYRILDYYLWNGNPNEGAKLSPDEQFKRIADFEKQHPWLKGRKITDSVADPAIWDASRGESIAETAMRYGIYFTPGDHKRIPGWMQIHYRFQFDENGYPRMYVFDTCKQFIRTIPLMMYSDTNPEDLDTSMEDHICVTGDTEVMTEDGSIPIAELVGKEPRVLSGDGQYHKCKDVRLTRRQAEIYELELEDGRTVRATGNHRFKMADGTWKRLDEMQEGDELWQTR